MQEFKVLDQSTCGIGTVDTLCIYGPDTWTLCVYMGLILGQVVYVGLVLGHFVYLLA